MASLPKVLVALDDSENAARAVEYVSKNFSPDHEVTLFSVMPDTQMLCNINSPELTPYFWSQRNVFCSVEDKKKELIQAAADRAKDVLLKAGFKKEKISVKVQVKKKGIASLDPVQYLLGKDDESPVHIEADTGPQDRDAVLPWQRISVRYADGCEIILDGENKDDAPFLSGPRGKLSKALESNIPDLEDKIRELPDPQPQVTDFVEAVKTRQKFALNEINGHRSCTLINLAKIAVQTGRPLRFNPQKQRFIDDPKANAFIRQPMRSPWKIKV